LFVRDTRSLFSRSGGDADRRAVARRGHQLRRQLYGLPARARAATSRGGNAGTQTAEVFETGIAMGTPGARARRTKSVDRVERYFEMAAQEAPEAELDVELIIPTPPKLANRIIELRDVSAELGCRTLFQHVNVNLVAGERLGVVGRNGLGKSSLLKVILQELSAASGAVEIGARTRINYVDQNRLLLDDEKTVWEEVGSGGEHVTLGEESISLRAYLRRFLFS